MQINNIVNLISKTSTARPEPTTPNNSANLDAIMKEVDITTMTNRAERIAQIQQSINNSSYALDNRRVASLMARELLL